MLPNFLLDEQVVRQDGAGPAVPLGERPPQAINVTLGITRIIEQESIDVSIWGSADGENWGDKPLAAFPQKFYCGVYTLCVDLSEEPAPRFLRVQWKLNRWGRGEPTPLFGLYVFGEPVSIPLQRAVGSASAA
jgi:hypothetical protein